MSIERVQLGEPLLGAGRHPESLAGFVCHRMMIAPDTGLWSPDFWRGLDIEGGAGVERVWMGLP
jgi:hypothetical protein